MGSLTAKDLNDSVYNRMMNAVKYKTVYILPGPNAPTGVTPISDMTPVEKLTKSNVDDIVDGKVAEVAKKWGGGTELAIDSFLTAAAGEKLESLIKSVAGLERDVREILARHKDR